jgi:ribosomal subunit interface protein
MLVPVQVTTRDIPISAALEAHIRKRAEKLNRFYDRISSCRVVLELPQKHKHQGKIYNVRIDITVPGKELVVTRKYDQDIYVAIRDAFDAIVRRLEEHSRRRKGWVKTHSDVLHGFITRIFPDQDYGFIEGTDGNEYYFSITNVGYLDFTKLAVGDAVMFIAEPLNDGWQAHRVIKERNHHAAA